MIIILLSIILLGGSCSRQVDESAMHCINFQEAVKNVSEVKLSEYVSALEYTPIETHPFAILGEIGSHFAADDSLIFFVYPNTQNCIYIFTRDGQYVKSIGKKGNGPGEYLGIRSMEILSEKNALFVEGGDKALIYSLSDGKCIEERSIHDFFDSSKDVIKSFKGRESMHYNMKTGNIIYHDDHIYASAADNTTHDQYFVKMKPGFSLDTIVRMKPTTLDTGMPWVVRSFVYLSGNKINILHGRQDTIYRWENESLVPHTLINFGEIPSITNMPQIRKTDPFLSPKTSHLRGKYAKIITLSSRNIVTETDNFFIGSVYLPDAITKAYSLEYIPNFIYDKTTRKTKLIKHSEELGYGAFTNDIDGGMPFWPSKHIGNKLYQFVDAGTFIEMSEKYNSPRMKEIAATLTENSNPVMIEATLK